MNELIKTEYLNLSLIIFIGGLLAPLITKTQGIVFSLTVLGLISFTMRFSSLIVVLLKKISIKTRILLLIIIYLINPIILLFYYIDIKLWISLQVIYTFIASVVIEMYYTEYDVIISKSDHFRDVQYNEKMISIISGSVGSLLSVILSNEPNIIIALAIIISIVLAIPLSIKQYLNLNNLQFLNKN